MNQPFPTSPQARKALHTQMLSAAPEVMDEISALRSSFPSAKLTHFKSASLEVGRPTDPAKGWRVSDEVVSQVAAAERKRNPPPEVVLQKKAAQKRSTAVKRRTR